MAAAHLRIYTINKGQMDDWLDLFHNKLVPVLNEAGFSVPSSWVNDLGTQFIWIRSCEKLEDIPKLEEKFYGSDWWQANVDFVRSHVAHREIVVMTSTGD
ncbi:MAG: hypothetical protein ACPID2_05990 [Candidatus Puniceispirillum sp.]